jgi:hypothetical protein
VGGALLGGSGIPVPTVVKIQLGPMRSLGDPFDSGHDCKKVYDFTGKSGKNSTIVGVRNATGS